MSWTSCGAVGGSVYDLFAQRYNPAGVAQGAEFQVNASGAGNQNDPSVAVAPDGGFVVTWSDNGIAGRQVNGRLFDPNGRPRGDTFGIYIGLGQAF